MREHEPRFENGESAEVNPREIERLRDRNYEKLEHEAEKALAEFEKQAGDIERIQESIRNSARSSHEIKRDSFGEKENNRAADKPMPANRQLKKHARKQTIKQVQRQLPRKDRAFSKIVHQPAVNAVSTVAEGTVARPSGLLFGAIFSVIGSLGVLYICKHYGYEYNFMIGMACFVGGFFLGLLVELIFRMFRRSAD